MDSGVDNTRELRKEIDIETDTREILARASRYAEERDFKDWLIIDVDAHHSELSSWKEVVKYIEDPVTRQTAIEMHNRTGAGAGLSNAVGGLRYQDVGGRIPDQTALEEAIDDDSVHRDVTLMLGDGCAEHRLADPVSRQPASAGHASAAARRGAAIVCL